MSSGDARSNFRQLLTDVDKGDHVRIDRYGAPTAVMVPTEWYERAVQALETDSQK